MNQIIYLLLLFSLLYLIETKAINILLSFVLIIISLAFLLPSLTINIDNIESEYFSYILILVQVSALTILFGFVIMLFPNLANSNPKSIKMKTYNSTTVENKNYRLILLFSSLIILLYYIYPKISEIFYFLKYFCNSKFSNSIDILNNLKSNDTLFLRKIGILLYSIDSNIIKLLVLTLILLLAIISLFFLLF